MGSVNIASLIAGVVSIGSAVSVASGHPALGALIADPNTAQAVTAIVGGVGGLWSLFAPALLHSTTTSAAATIKADAGPIIPSVNPRR